MYFKGTPIYNSGHPWSYVRGGNVPFRANMTPRQKTHDSVQAILMPGELVIPMKHKGFKRGGLVKNVIHYLHNMGVRLPNT